ncbi:MAG TPA: hypothetical protein VGH94_15725 [Acidimicrobiales bacterium]|jgi:hypothetical protein
MSRAVVSFTHLTMGKLFLRTVTPEKMAGLGAAATDALMSHWTLRESPGTVIIEVHADDDAFRRDLTRSRAMFEDPIHRLRFEAYPFVDDAHEEAAVVAFAKVRAAAVPPPAGAPGELKNRLLSLTLIPHLADGMRGEVRTALDDHEFLSVLHLAVQTPHGELLIDPYLDEQDLMDDFVFVRGLLSGTGIDAVNRLHAFVDRAHERAIDEVAVALGRLDEIAP